MKENVIVKCRTETVNLQSVYSSFKELNEKVRCQAETSLIVSTEAQTQYEKPLISGNQAKIQCVYKVFLILGALCSIFIDICSLTECLCFFLEYIDDKVHTASENEKFARYFGSVIELMSEIYYCFAIIINNDKHRITIQSEIIFNLLWIFMSMDTATNGFEALFSLLNGSKTIEVIYWCTGFQVLFLLMGIGFELVLARREKNDKAEIIE